VDDPVAVTCCSALVMPAAGRARSMTASSGEALSQIKAQLRQLCANFVA
jgi:hypothetical protein